MFDQRRTIKVHLIIPLFILVFNGAESWVFYKERITPTHHNYFYTSMLKGSFTFSLYETIIQTSAVDSVIRTHNDVCQHCSMTFPSRNALFRHIRTAHVNMSNISWTLDDYVKKSVALLCAYDSYSTATSSTTWTSTTTTHPSEAEQIGDLIQHAFWLGLQSYYNFTTPLDSMSTPQILSRTQCTVPKMRHVSLSQEPACSSSGDVISIAYTIPLIQKIQSESKEDESKRLDYVLSWANEYLYNHTSNSSRLFITNTYTGASSTPSARTSHVTYISILSATSMPYTKYFHAEKSCTQKAYHYLLPLSWLPDGSSLEQWKLQSGNSLSWNRTTVTKQQKIKSKFGLSNRWEQAATEPPPSDTLKIFKTILRKVESCRIATSSLPSKNTQDSSITDKTRPKAKIAMGRYGSLAYKEKTCWHNYADPTLQGDISPNHEPVWRTMDHCRIVQLLPLSNHNESTIENSKVYALIEFRGDDFLPQQVRRIIATAVAMTHGWLPPSFLEYSTQPHVFLETPLAPEDRMYFAGARFHWEELEKEGRGIFDHETRNDPSKVGSVLRDTQHRLLQRWQSRQEDEVQWLNDLRDVIAPRIRKQMEQQILHESDVVQENASSLRNPPPPMYDACLAILRSIKNGGLWPTTSSARSKVIKNIGEINAGSFTVLNPKFNNGILFRENEYNISIPLGNDLFPDLVEAVFDLERRLTSLVNVSDPHCGPRSSSHCAINCNAQFTPHVDSGRGSGQSLSLIVGLGDYQGGEIFVEGHPHNIRYEPLEFNGWRQRHWTAPFVGERFSLVWFTPELT